MTLSWPRPIIIVDDEEGVRASLATLLSLESFAVRTFASGAAALARLDEIADGCIVTDVKMPGLSGLDLLRQVRSAGLATPVVVMTGHADVQMAVMAMKMGATDFIEKPFDPNDLIGMLRSLSTNSVSDAEAEIIRARLSDLSAREREVFDLVTAGSTNKEAAARLGLSPRTVEIHRANLMQKLGVKRLSGLIHLAMRAASSPSPAADVYRDHVGVCAGDPTPHIADRDLQR